MERLTGKYITIGPPGTGKTTQLVAQAAACLERGQRVLVCSLTRTAKAEVIARGLDSPNLAVGTLHGHAYNAIGRPEMLKPADYQVWNEEHPVYRLTDGVDSDDPYGAKRETDGDRLLAGWNLARHKMLVPRSILHKLRSHDVRPMRKPGGAGAGAEILPGMSRGLHESVADDAPADPGAAPKDERESLRPRLPQTREADAGTVSGLRGSEKRNPTHRLQPSAGNPVAMPEVSIGGDAFPFGYNAPGGPIAPKMTRPAGVARDVYEFGRLWEAWKAGRGRIDFTDQIDFALGAEPPEFDVLLHDEAQDSSALEWALIEWWSDHAEAVVSYGDSWQVLFRWRGASPTHLSPTGAAGYKVLGQSYRLSPAVHRLAVNWVKENLSVFSPIDYRPTDRYGSGSVEHVAATYRAPERAVDLAAKYADAGESTVLLASCAYFLIPTLAALRSRGLPYDNPWRTNRGQWNPLSRTGEGVGAASRLVAALSAYDPDAELGHTMVEFAHWTEACPVKGFLRRAVRPQIEQIAHDNPGDSPVSYLFAWCLPETLDDVRALVSGDMTIDEAIEWYARMAHPKHAAALKYAATVIRTHGFAALREPPRIHVGTVHSLKGGEADNVIFYPDLSFAGFEQWEGAPEDRDDIVRQVYVAITRARKRFILARQGARFGVEIFF